MGNRSPFFKVRSLEAPNVTFENATLESAYGGMDLSGASITSSTITNSSVIFNDTYVREANLYLIGGEGSVRGTPYYLSDHIKIKNGNLIGERVRNDGANSSHTDLTDVEFNEYSSFVELIFTVMFNFNWTEIFQGQISEELKSMMLALQLFQT